MSGKSYSQIKRGKLDYNEEYFKHNPGLFGCIWICAYCGRAIVGKSNVEVDHITPLASHLGPNKRYNLVSSCRDCNRAKSDIIDKRVPIGYLSKIIQTIVYSIQKIFIILFVACWTLLLSVGRFLLHILLQPFKSSSWLIKLGFAVLYATLVYFYIL